jgi:hypothetical protein
VIDAFGSYRWIAGLREEPRSEHYSG